LANPSDAPNWKSLASATAEVLKGNPKFWGAPLAQGHNDFFFWWDLIRALTYSSCMPNLKSLASSITEI